MVRYVAMDKPNEGSKKFAHTHGTPPRVAPRLEGKVKNLGIKPKRKQKKTRKNPDSSSEIRS